MRLKIEITGGLFSDPGEDRTRDLATVILFRLCLRIVEHNQSDKFGMVRREIAAERNDFLTFLVSAVRPNFLRGTSLARDDKAGNCGRRSGAAIAYYAAQAPFRFDPQFGTR